MYSPNKFDINKNLKQLASTGYNQVVNGKSFPGGSDGKESACNAGDPGSIPRSGRSPGEGNGNPLQYSCLENSHGQQHARLPCPSYSGGNLNSSVQFSSVTQLCPTLCDPMNCSTPGLLLHHQLPEFTQTIKSVMPSGHLILCHPSPSGLSLSQHQGLFQ